MKTPTHLFDITATVKPATLTTTNGSTVITWPTSTSVDGRLSKGDGKEEWIDGKVVRYDYVFYTSPTVAVSEKDRMAIGSKTYEVLAVNDMSSKGVIKRILLKLEATNG
jgi:hypothetical protein